MPGTPRRSPRRSGPIPSRPAPPATPRSGAGAAWMDVGPAVANQLFRLPRTPLGGPSRGSGHRLREMPRSAGQGHRADGGADQRLPRSLQSRRAHFRPAGWSRPCRAGGQGRRQATAHRAIVHGVPRPGLLRLLPREHSPGHRDPGPGAGPPVAGALAQADPPLLARPRLLPEARPARVGQPGDLCHLSSAERVPRLPPAQSG